MFKIIEGIFMNSLEILKKIISNFSELLTEFFAIKFLLKLFKIR